MKKMIYSMIGIATSLSAISATFTTPTSKVGYAIGYQMGSSLKAQQVAFDTQAFVAGLEASLNGTTPELTTQQMQVAMEDFRKQMTEKLNAAKQQNVDAGAAYLEKNKIAEGVHQTSSGLQYKILTAGTGVKPAFSDTVTVDYEGTLINGTVFDSSYKRGAAATFPVNAVIAGWTEALQLMPVGSTWMLYIPSNLAYGERGAGGAIGPNQTLIFKVHLIKIN